MSAIDKRFLKAAAVGACASLLCGIFSIIYLKLSYGQSSPFMTFLFAPVLANAVLSGLLGITGAGRVVSRAAFNLWNSAVALATAGMMFRAIVNISGRVTEFDTVYYILAAVFGAAAVLTAVVSAIYHKGVKV